MRNDRGHEEVAVASYLDSRPTRRDAASGLDRRTLVTAGSQPCGFAGGVDATYLHRHRGDTGQAQHQHHDQRSDGQGGLDGAGARTAG